MNRKTGVLLGGAALLFILFVAGGGFLSEEPDGRMEQLQKLSELSEKQAEEAELLSRSKREDFAQSDLRLRKAEESTRDLVKTIVAGLEKG